MTTPQNEPLPPTVSVSADEPLGPKEAAPEANVYSGFEVKGEIGRGGMGAVYLAREKSPTRDVALKVLVARADSGDQRRQLRFLEEANVTAQLQHPGIVPVYRIAEDQRGRPYYTMRPIEGRVLGAILDDLRHDDPVTHDRFHLRRLTQIFQSCCQAVRFAHDRGVIHRDLKPSNVVVGDYGEVLVIDWGLAKTVGTGGEAAGKDKSPADADVWKLYEQRVVSLREDEASDFGVTADGIVMGTPPYMSPEQALGHVQELDARCDIWSLGVMLYELCTLKRPFEGNTLREIASQITTMDPPDPARVNPKRRVPPELRDIILRCLRRDKSQRYASIAELLVDIEHWLDGIAPWRVVKDMDFANVRDGEPEGWTNVVGRWRVESGSLRGMGKERGNVLLLKTPVVGDARVEVEAMIDEHGQGEISLILCADGPEPAAKLASCYVVQFGAQANSCSRVLRNLTEVAREDARNVPGHWHHVRVEKVSNLLRLTVDGREILRWGDREPLSGTMVGIYTYGVGLRVRRYRLATRGYPLTVSCLDVPRAFQDKGLFEEARGLYLQVAENHPARDEGVEALFLAGKCSLALAQKVGAGTDERERLLAEALASFDRVERTALAPMGCLGKSLICEARGDIEAEVAELARAYEAYPGAARLHLVGERLWERAIGLRLNFDDNIRSALFCMPALRFHPAGANSSRALEAVARIPDIALAEARLSELIARSPSPYDRFMARKALTQNRYWNDRYREAEDLIRERIDHPEGNDPDIAFLDLSRVREMQGRYSEAAAILEGGIFAPGRPFRGTALGYMLGVYIHSRNWHAVRQCALTILAEPSDTYYEASIVNFNSGIAFLMQGRIQETRAELQKDIPASQISQAIIDKTSILLGFALCAEGRHEEAIKHLSGLYKSDGSQRSALEFARAIALVHAIAGQRQEVVEPLRRSATEHPDFAARKALHPDDPAVVEAFEIFAAQYHSDYALVSALLAYARGNDAVAADLLRQSLDNGVDQIYQTLEWPIRRLLEQISGAKTLP